MLQQVFACEIINWSATRLRPISDLTTLVILNAVYLLLQVTIALGV